MCFVITLLAFSLYKPHNCSNLFSISFHSTYKTNTAQSILILSLRSTACTNQAYYAIYSHSITSLHRWYTSSTPHSPFSFHHFIPQGVQIKPRTIHTNFITSLHSAYKSDTTQFILVLSLNSAGRTNQAPYNSFSFYHLIPQGVQIKHHTIHSRSFASFHRLYKSNTIQFILVSTFHFTVCTN